MKYANWHKGWLETVSHDASTESIFWNTPASFNVLIQIFELLVLMVGPSKNGITKTLSSCLRIFIHHYQNQSIVQNSKFEEIHIFEYPQEKTII